MSRNQFIKSNAIKLGSDKFIDIVKQIDDPEFTQFKQDQETIEKARFDKRQIRNQKIKSLYNEMISGSGPTGSTQGSRSRKKAAANEFLGFKVQCVDQISATHHGPDSSINIGPSSSQQSSINVGRHDPGATGFKLLQVDVETRIKGHSQVDLKKKMKEDDAFMKRLNLRTSQSVRNGVLNPALKRSMVESVGYVSFNKARNMYPTQLHVEKKEDGIFEMCPHLKEFKKDERQLQRDHEKSNKENKGTNIRPVNSCYKSKTGVTYGLY